MKQVFRVLLVPFVLVITIHSSAFARNGAPSHPAVAVTPHVPGVVYVKMRPGSQAIVNYKHIGVVAQSVGASTFSQVLDQLHATATQPFDADAPKDKITTDLGIDRMYVIYYSNRSIDPERALTMLLATGEVECGSVRYLFPLSLMPNDADLSAQYALDTMALFAAWNITTGDSNVLIADVDDGFNTIHEDLKHAIKIGYDVVGNISSTSGKPFEPDSNPMPDYILNTHGSHTAGCIAATGNNNVGIAGTAFGCRLIAVKAAGKDYDESDTGGILGGYEGIHYASTHGARVINCSWGGPVSGDLSFANTWLIEAQQRNALVVAAAGNNATDVDVTAFYPACGPGVLSIGATDQLDNNASFTNYGASVSAWAPGVQIYSCTYPGTNVYDAEDGTSFSSPLAAGVAGLVASLHPDWPPQFIARQIHATCQNNIDQGLVQDSYWGIINADSALLSIPQPGLLASDFSIDGVSDDSLRDVGQSHTLSVTFKNYTAAGSTITATMVKGIGYIASTTVASLGTVNLDATVKADFQITRNGVYSQGTMPVRFYLTDGAQYKDTVTLYLPLAVQPGFIVERSGTAGQSVKQLSNSAAWATFGDEATTGGAVFAQFARQTGGVWGDTTTLYSMKKSPYDLDAWDSLTAWFGTGPHNLTSASVIRTTDGGQTFTDASVSNFTPFVNSVHFFSSTSGVPAEGVIVGDPASSSSISVWGIGRSLDGGATWTHVSTAPKNTKTGEASWNNATAWVGDKGWFGSNDSHIWRTTDRGNTWTAAKTTLLNSLALAFDDDGLHGFACFRPATQSGGSSSSGTKGMNVTADGGVTWTKLAMPVAGMVPGEVAFVPKSDMAIVTGDSGVYRTTDFGATWSPIGVPLGLDAANASFISIYRGQGKFTVSMITSLTGVASYSEAMPDSVLDTVRSSVADQQTPTIALAISPNPFQQDVTISFTLPVREHARLAIVDDIGREVGIVMDGEFDSGMQSASFHAGQLPAGTYYAMLVTAQGQPVMRAISLER